MSLDNLNEILPAYAKDIKLNLANVLSETGSTGLSQHTIHGVVLACAYATRDSRVIEAMELEVKSDLDEAHINAAKAAATIMAMNNIYYRFIHLVHDEDLSHMPPRLRMTVFGTHGIEKKDFELYCLAVSAINGCGKCMEAHTKALLDIGVDREAIQSAVRIAAVIFATAQALV